MVSDKYTWIENDYGLSHILFHHTFMMVNRNVYRVILSMYRKWDWCVSNYEFIVHILNENKHNMNLKLSFA